MGDCCSSILTEMQKLCLSCCFSIDVDKNQTGEPTERTTLLGNPVSNNHLSQPLFGGGDAYQPEIGIPACQVPDDEAALKRILHQTVCDIIDVSAIPPHLEPKEYLDRMTMYQEKLQNVQYHPTGVDPKPLLRDMSYPEKVLSENPLSLTDFRTLKESFADMYRAFQDVKVQPHADLIGQFGSS